MDTTNHNGSCSTADNLSRKRNHATANDETTNYTLADCERALAAEKDAKAAEGGVQVVIKYPDPITDLDRLSDYFLDPINLKPSQRCIRLKPNCDPGKVIEEINRIPFNNSHLRAELADSEREVRAEDIIPCTLRVTNIDKAVTACKLKALFPGARVSIYNSTMYKEAKIAYKTADEAISAFKQNVNKQLESRALRIRFYRVKTVYENGAKKFPDTQVETSRVQLSNVSHTSESDSLVEVKKEQIDYCNVQVKKEADFSDIAAAQLKRDNQLSIKSEPGVGSEPDSTNDSVTTKSEPKDGMNRDYPFEYVNTFFLDKM